MGQVVRSGSGMRTGSGRRISRHAARVTTSVQGMWLAVGHLRLLHARSQGEGCGSTGPEAAGYLGDAKQLRQR
eukprot:7232248-Pyramimonas_sp.AAC.1